MSSFSSTGPVDILMSSPPSTFLPFSPSSSSPIAPRPSSSTPPPLPLPLSTTSSSLSSFDAPIDSPTSLSLFILRCREEVGHHARVLLATKLTNVNDEQIRQIFLDTGGLDILLSWLDPSTNSAPVLSHTLDALSVLPLTSSHLSSHPSLLSTLTSLRTHSDESISQSADDLLATLERQRREGNDKEEKDVDDAGDQSKFRSIKIDKSTADVHSEAGHKEEAAAPVKLQLVAFDESLSPPRSPSEEAKAQVSAEMGKQAAMEAMADEGSAVSSGVGLGKRKRKGLSVSWQEEDRLESVRLFFKEEPIVKREKKSIAGDARDGFAFSLSHPMLPSTPLTPTLDWYPPPKLSLPPLLQTQLQSRGHLSTEKQTQLQREKGVLRSVYIPGQELPPNPAESPESLNSPAVNDADVPIIPFEVAKYTPPPEAVSLAESKPSGAEFSHKTHEILSKLSQLTSLASLLPSSSTSTVPVSTPQYPTAPPTAPSSLLSSMLSSLSSNLSGYSAASLSSYSASPYTAGYAPQPPAAVPQPLPSPAPLSSSVSAASSSGPLSSTSKLLSLLKSDHSALSSLAAAIQPAPPAAAAPTPPPASAPMSYAPYAAQAAPAPALPPASAYPAYSSPYAPPPPPPSSYQPPPSTYYQPTPSTAASYPPALSQPLHYPQPSPALYGHPPAPSYPSPSPYAPQPSPSPYSPPNSPYSPYPTPYPQSHQREEHARGRIPKRRRMDEGPPGGGRGGGLLPVEDLPMYKTKPCNYWVQTGRCKLGEKCSFFHEGVDQPRRPPHGKPQY